MARPLHRRTFLRGAGVAMTLPWLEAMSSPAAAAAGKPPARMACMYFPNGVWQPAWIPEKAGPDFELPFSLTPLGDLKRDVVVLSNLDKANSRNGDGHYAKTANFLTGQLVVKTTGKDVSVGGASLDQVAAAHVGRVTPLPSLELGLDPVISGIDSNVGYTRLYGSHISWQSPSQPVAKEINPRLVYERLFGATGGRREEDRNLLDLALDDAKALRQKLGRDDQFKMDEYLDAVRAVERRIEYAAQPDPREWKPDTKPDVPPAPSGVPAEFREHLKLMLDLMVLAFWTDTTRVTSLMFANDVSGRNFSFVDGVKGGHHDLSHHENNKQKIEQYQRINRWHVEQFAYFLTRLKAIKEGSGTLLDNSMVLFGCGMSDGNRHDPNNLPILLGGRAGGALKTGQHIASSKNTPLCNLYLSMLRAMGVDAKSFGDSTGELKGLT